MKKKIIICEDNEGVRESFKLILKGEYTLFFAKEAKQAIGLLKSEKPDLVLMDIKLPKMDGIAALKEIKNIDPSIPVVMITGYKSTETAKLATKHGAFDYITKPLNSDEVRSVVEKALTA